MMETVETSELRTEMPNDFSGTNTERIDKLVAAVIEMRTTLRIFAVATTIFAPMMMGLISFFVVQTFTSAAQIAKSSDQTSAQIAKVSDQIAAMRSDYVKLAERLDRLERPTRP